MVGLGGLEPPTSRLSGVRSNQLSYRPIQKSEDRSQKPEWFPACGCLNNCAKRQNIHFLAFWSLVSETYNSLIISVHQVIKDLNDPSKLNSFIR